jgi:hypothetical protein
MFPVCDIKEYSVELNFDKTYVSFLEYFLLFRKIATNSVSKLTFST